MAEKPLLWKLFDAAEGAVAPRLEKAVRSGAFLGGLGVAARVRAGARRRIDDRTRALWHLVNLPAGSDIARLRREVAALDRELRRMSTGLERAMADLEEGAPRRSSSGARRTTADPEERDADDPGARNGRAPRARRAARPGAPRRGAQRAPGA